MEMGMGTGMGTVMEMGMATDTIVKKYSIIY